MIRIPRAQRAPLYDLGMIVAVVMTLLIGALAAGPAQAATFTVDTTDDPGTGVCDATECTLREAINEANGNLQSDTINFAPGLSGTTILGNGQLLISNDNPFGQDLSIEGPGGNGLTVSGNNASRVFEMASDAGITINRLTIRKGKAPPRELDGERLGGGIFNNGTLTLINSTVSDNTADHGGGIFNNGTLTLINSTVSTNTTTGSAGAIANAYPTTLALTNSTVSGNHAGDNGGGIVNGGTAILRNTILAGNTATVVGTDAYGNDFISEGNNLIGNTSSTGGFVSSDLLNVNPLLGPLQNNGGPTNTHALLQGSPAIDAGTNTGCLATDQRGVVRQDGDANGITLCDIGAFEAANTKPTITKVKPVPGSKTHDRTPPIAATVRDSQSNLAKSDIKLFVDGRRKSTFSYNRSTDRLSYTSGRLSFKSHAVKIVATEGVQSTTKKWSFKVLG